MSMVAHAQFGNMCEVEQDSCASSVRDSSIFGVSNSPGHQANGEGEEGVWPLDAISTFTTMSTTKSLTDITELVGKTTPYPSPACLVAYKLAEWFPTMSSLTAFPSVRP